MKRILMIILPIAGIQLLSGFRALNVTENSVIAVGPPPYVMNARCLTSTALRDTVNVSLKT